MAASSSTISLRASNLVSTEATAQRHCESHGRKTVFQGQGSISRSKTASLYIYDCRPITETGGIKERTNR